MAVDIRNYHRTLISGTPSAPSEVSIAYLDVSPDDDASYQGTILLIHGFPETSYQFRHVIPLFVAKGYRVVAPDCRGAGHSSHPRDGYTKSIVAADIHELLTKHMEISSPVHVVGHDIGGMVAHAYASRYPEATKTVSWGECPLPGTKQYDDMLLDPGLWHFHFHWQIDLPEQLIQGREAQYIKHFYDRLTMNPHAIDQETLDYYTMCFSQSGAVRSGLDMYRAFHKDKEENKEWLDKHGKCKVPCLTLNGDQSFLAQIAEAQAKEMYGNVSVANVKGSGHWCAEENPPDFVDKVVSFVQRYT